MKIEIYRMINTPQGAQRDNTPVAWVELFDGKTDVECNDTHLKEKIQTLFSNPIRKKIPTRRGNIITHQFRVLKPSTKEFFKEIIYHLHKIRMMGILVEE